MGYFISAEPSAAEMAAMLALTAGSSGSSGPNLCDGSNLILNPSCEDGGSPPADWKEAHGTWQRQHSRKEKTSPLPQPVLS